MQIYSHQLTIEKNGSKIQNNLRT